MKLDIEQFSSLQKASKASFFEQKRMLKQITSGKTVLCKSCKQPLRFYTPEAGEATGIRCDKGCTNIALDFV